MSKIKIEGRTTISKDLIVDEVLNVVKGRLMAIKEEMSEIEKELEYYRKEYKISDNEFLERFNSGNLGDDEEFFVWDGSLKIREKLITEHEILSEVL